MARGVATRVGALLSCIALGACGGGGGSPTAVATPTPVPTPFPPRVVLQDNMDLGLEYAYGWYFDTDGPGTVDATIDYTYADSQLAIWISRGMCTYEQWVANQCDYVATSFAGPKPRRVSATGLSAGTYSLVIWNIGPHDESLSFQVVFTRQPGASSSAVSSAQLESRANGWAAAIERH